MQKLFGLKNQSNLKLDLKIFFLDKMLMVFSTIGFIHTENLQNRSIQRIVAKKY